MERGVRGRAAKGRCRGDGGTMGTGECHGGSEVPWGHESVVGTWVCNRDPGVWWGHGGVIGAWTYDGDVDAQ